MKQLIQYSTYTIKQSDGKQDKMETVKKECIIRQRIINSRAVSTFKVKLKQGQKCNSSQNCELVFHYPYNSFRLGFNLFHFTDYSTSLNHCFGK